MDKILRAYKVQLEPNFILNIMTAEAMPIELPLTLNTFLLYLFFIYLVSVVVSAIFVSLYNRWTDYQEFSAVSPLIPFINCIVTLMIIVGTVIGVIFPIIKKLLRPVWKAWEKLMNIPK